MKAERILRVLKQYEEHIIVAFLLNWKPKEIQEAAHISKSTYYKLKNDPDFQRILTERRNDVVREAVKKMESYLLEDIDIVQDVIRDPKTSGQVKINGTQLMMNQLNTWKASTEVIDRLQQLEADAQSQNNAF